MFLASHAHRFVAMRRAELLTALPLQGLPSLPSALRSALRSASASVARRFAARVHEILFTIWEKGTAYVSAAF